MRLSEEYRRHFVQATHETFGAGAVVRLFGSRLNDRSRGGDFDLHVEADRPGDAGTLSPATRLRAILSDRLDGEPIDLVVRYRDEPERWIDRLALDQGVIL